MPYNSFFTNTITRATGRARLFWIVNVQFLRITKMIHHLPPIAVIILAFQISGCTTNQPVADAGQTGTGAVTAKQETVTAGQDNHLGPGNKLTGIDVSHYQGEVDWSTVSQQPIHFVFIKSSQGHATVDSQYKNNWQQTAQTELLRGVYHFLDPSVDATAQAEHFAATTQGDFGDFPPVIDIEAFEKQSADEIIQVLDVFISHLEDRFGCRPMIYTSPGFWDQLDNHRFGEYSLWLADYASQPKLPNGWDNWIFWQFESNGELAGIKGKVDKSRFAGDAEKLQRLKCKVSA